MSRKVLYLDSDSVAHFACYNLDHDMEPANESVKMMSEMMKKLQTG